MKDNAKDFKATPNHFRLIFSVSTFVSKQMVDLSVNPYHFIPLNEIVNAEESCYPDYFIGNVFLNF